MGNHDFQMPEANELAARESLQHLLGTLPALDARQQAIVARPGGLLARENRQTAYSPIETQVNHLITTAWEPLETCTRLLRDGLPMLSLYPLIRSSLESSGYGIWLISPGTSHRRVLRSLRLTKDRREDADQTTSAWRPVDPEKTRLFLNRLNQLKGMNKRLEQSSLDTDFPGPTDILVDAGRHVQTTPHDLVTAWRICSGFAHANDALMQRLLERRQLSEYEDGVASFHMTSSFVVVEQLVRPAVQALTALVDRFETRAVEA